MNREQGVKNCTPEYVLDEIRNLCDLAAEAAHNDPERFNLWQEISDHLNVTADEIRAAIDAAAIRERL